VTWSPGDVDIGVQTLLIQFYPIILSTLLSINRQQLSRFDAYFALRVSSSPLTIYLVFTSVCDLCGIHTGLYKRIKTYRHIIRTTGALVLLLWTGLSMTIVMSASAFKGELCDDWTFVQWLWFLIKLLVFTLMFPGVVGVLPGLAWVIITPWVACLARRWSQLKADVKLHSEGASRLRVFCTWVKCAWCVPVGVNPRLAET